METGPFRAMSGSRSHAPAAACISGFLPNLDGGLRAALPAPSAPPSTAREPRRLARLLQRRPRSSWPLGGPCSVAPSSAPPTGLGVEPAFAASVVEERPIPEHVPGSARKTQLRPSAVRPPALRPPLPSGRDGPPPCPTLARARPIRGRPPGHRHSAPSGRSGPLSGRWPGLGPGPPRRRRIVARLARVSRRTGRSCLLLDEARSHGLHAPPRAPPPFGPYPGPFPPALAGQLCLPSSLMQLLPPASPSATSPRWRAADRRDAGAASATLSRARAGRTALHPNPPGLREAVLASLRQRGRRRPRRPKLRGGDRRLRVAPLPLADLAQCRMSGCRPFAGTRGDRRRSTSVHGPPRGARPSRSPKPSGTPQHPRIANEQAAILHFLPPRFTIFIPFRRQQAGGCPASPSPAPYTGNYLADRPPGDTG